MQRYVLTVIFSQDLPGLYNSQPPAQPRVVLLTKKHGPSMLHGKFNYPGGKIEPGETPAQAAAREVAEETGLVIAAEDLAYVDEVHVPGEYQLSVFAGYHPHPELAQSMTDEDISVHFVTDIAEDARANPHKYAPDFEAWLTLSADTLLG